MSEKDSDMAQMKQWLLNLLQLIGSIKSKNVNVQYKCDYLWYKYLVFKDIEIFINKFKFWNKNDMPF